MTRSKPKDANPRAGYRHFYTLLYIGCKYADGATTEDAMIQGVWAHFQDRAVAKVDGSPLKYYGKWRNGNLASYTHELLDPAREHGGMCMAWTRLFLDVFKVQGFQEPDNFIKVKSYTSQGFFVKNWTTYAGSGTSLRPGYPYRNELLGSHLHNENNTYNWTYSEVFLITASQSQNNNNPQPDFVTHIFARISGILYDPSYGVSYGYSNNNEGDMVPELDNNGIDSYFMFNVHPTGMTYEIQMNYDPFNDYLIIFKADPTNDIEDDY